MAEKIHIASQIAEVRREIALRKNVYPGLVAKGKLRQSEADLCLARMEAVHATLMFCSENEADIRAYMASKREAAS